MSCAVHAWSPGTLKLSDRKSKGMQQLEDGEAVADRSAEVVIIDNDINYRIQSRKESSLEGSP